MWGLISFIFISSLTLFDIIIANNPCGLLQYYEYAFISFGYFSFWNVHFDPSVIFINSRVYKTSEVVVFFYIVSVKSFYIIIILFSVSVVMGIPTVKREVKSYLTETLHSLIDNLYPEEKLDCVIVVFIGEVII